MIRTPINKDIGKLKNNVLFGLSWRESVYCILALVVGTIVFFLVYPYTGISIAAWITMLCIMPIGASGFFNVNGIYLMGIVKEILFPPQPLIYKTDYEEKSKEEEKNKKHKRRCKNKCSCKTIKGQTSQDSSFPKRFRKQ